MACLRPTNCSYSQNSAGPEARSLKGKGDVYRVPEDRERCLPLKAMMMIIMHFLFVQGMNCQ